MKSTGLVRKIDNLGRIVLAKELRRKRDWKEGTPLEAYVDGDAVILKKYEPGCVICGGMEGLAQFKGKNVCKDCRAGK